LFVVCALLIWEPAYNKFKDWQLKRAFLRREKADRERAKRVWMPLLSCRLGKTILARREFCRL
jgi:hypothetical protein